MSYEEGQVTLVEFLASMPVRENVEKSLFGKLYLRLGAYYEILHVAYQDGALLGRAKRDKLSILKKMLVEPEAKSEPLELGREMAEKYLNQYIKEVGSEPSAFTNFLDRTTVGYALTPYGLNLTEPPWNEGEVAKLSRVFNKKIPVDDAARNVKAHTLGGIGFGISFPELTEKMIRTDYLMDRYYDVLVRDERFEKPMLISSLEEREKAVILLTAHYPELVDPLDSQKELNLYGKSDNIILRKFGFKSYAMDALDAEEGFLTKATRTRADVEKLIEESGAIHLPKIEQDEFLRFLCRDTVDLGVDGLHQLSGAQAAAGYVAMNLDRVHYRTSYPRWMR